MNPKGAVVNENTNGIITVNGHSYSDPKLQSKNTNFALLVSNRFTEPFHSPHQYGKRIASFSNLLGGGIIVQRFGERPPQQCPPSEQELYPPDPAGNPG